MKLKVTKRYVDRYTKKTVEAGSTIDPNDSRAKELIAQGVAELAEKQKNQEKTSKVAPEQQKGE